MPVELVLAKLATNPDVDEFFLDYPELTIDDIKAALLYARSLVVGHEEAADEDFASVVESSPASR